MARRSLEHEADETVVKVANYLRKALVPQKEVEKGRSRADALRDKFDSLGINLEALRSRRNPFNADHDGVYFHMGEFVAEGIPFTPKDLAEHLSECGLPLKSSSITSEVSRFVAALVEAGILKKEKRIICLA